MLKYHGWQAMNIFHRVWRNWARRHRSRTNIALHAVGIPTKLAGVPAAIAGYYLLAVVLIVVGFGLQFLGHWIEGTRSGERMLVRRVFGRGREGVPCDGCERTGIGD